MRLPKLITWVLSYWSSILVRMWKANLQAIASPFHYSDVSLSQALQPFISSSPRSMVCLSTLLVALSAVVGLAQSAPLRNVLPYITSDAFALIVLYCKCEIFQCHPAAPSRGSSAAFSLKARSMQTFQITVPSPQEALIKSSMRRPKTVEHAGSTLWKRTFLTLPPNPLLFPLDEKRLTNSNALSSMERPMTMYHL
ncbi:hypothetical protein DL96DRAFT_1579249 [Flagelloscypha sp. PMI_526]|nr:hypothetical protein DL96DRAFT_1579249 [Flagelloscypha sp. PMI_526]